MASQSAFATTSGLPCFRSIAGGRCAPAYREANRSSPFSPGQGQPPRYHSTALYELGELEFISASFLSVIVAPSSDASVYRIHRRAFGAGKSQSQATDTGVGFGGVGFGARQFHIPECRAGIDELKLDGDAVENLDAAETHHARAG
jgi:hypothetical protein